MLTMFSTKLCGKCKMYKRALNELNISFTELDISNDSEKKATIKALGFSKLPVFMVNDEYYDDFESVLKKIK